MNFLEFLARRMDDMLQARVAHIAVVAVSVFLSTVIAVGLAALAMRQEILDRYPAIAEIMAPISAVLIDEVITGLDARVDVDGEEPADVAAERLESEASSPAD